MSLGTDLTKEVRKIFQDAWSIRKGQNVPESEDLRLDNDAVDLNGTVLYADLDRYYKSCRFLQTHICR